jgi:hypothetical protein
MAARLRLIGLCIVLVGVLAACVASGPTVSATPRAVPSVTGSIPNSTGSSAPDSGPKVGQTDTAWGRIWDGLPSGFPPVPDATPDENAAGDPASAVLVIEGGNAAGVSTFLQTQLRNAGYTTVGSPEPLEDGSVVLDMTGHGADCKIQVTVTPTGGLTTVRILYGAACPFE